MISVEDAKQHGTTTHTTEVNRSSKYCILARTPGTEWYLQYLERGESGHPQHTREVSLSLLSFSSLSLVASTRIQ